MQRVKRGGVINAPAIRWTSHFISFFHTLLFHSHRCRPTRHNTTVFDSLTRASAMAAVTYPQASIPGPGPRSTTHAGIPIPLTRPGFQHLPTDFPLRHGHHSSTSIDARRSVERRSFDAREVDIVIHSEKSGSASPRSHSYSQSLGSHLAPLRPSTPTTFPPRRAEIQPVAQLAVRAARDRLSCGSKSGALGRGLIIGWVITTLGFLAATAFWKGELFSGE